MSIVHRTNRETNMSMASSASLLRTLIKSYLRAGLVAMLALVGVGIAAGLPDQGRLIVGLERYPQDSMYSQPPSQHPAGLSADEVVQLLNGQDGAYARTAQFHNYPSPEGVLPLADELLLSPEQVRQVESILTKRQELARSIGGEIVYLEAQFGSAFGDERVSQDYLHAQSERLGRLYGKLRATHLESYLAVVDILSPIQLEQYRQLRTDQDVTIE